MKSLSLNSKIKIEIGANTGDVGINDGKIYYKSSKNAEAKYLGVSPVAMIAFAGNKVPNSCLLCDGGAVGKRSYPDLFGVIDTAYGGSASNFKFPDFRGMFFERCWFINY